MSSPKVTFLSQELEIKGSHFTFQIAELKGNWAIRIIDRKKNKILTVVKLPRTTDAAITEKIKDVLGRKYGKKLIKKIDFFDLGGKMPELLQQIHTYKETGQLPDGSKIGSAMPDGVVTVSKENRKPDSFWSAYASAPKAEPASYSLEAESISFDMGALGGDQGQPQQQQPAPTSSALDSSLSILGVNCPSCGQEVDIEHTHCPNCGKELD